MMDGILRLPGRRFQRLDLGVRLAATYAAPYIQPLLRVTQAPRVCGIGKLQHGFAARTRVWIDVGNRVGASICEGHVEQVAEKR